MESERAPDTTPRRKTAVTGSARKLKDNAADWHNLILKWDKLNDEGSTIANKIVNLGISKGSQQQHNMMLEDLEGSISTNTEETAGHSRELEEECSKLLAVVDRMSRVVSKMEKLVSTGKGVLELEMFQCGAAGRLTPLFLTWPTTLFVEVSAKLYEAYSQELRLKQAILQELAHTSSPDLSMVHLSCWLHQPYLDDSLRLQLEGLLLETGHRTL
ncbi:cyclin-dependent kinase 2-interacting protein [Osmerus mordax]|uniref:cyclin-dependent kinase 2-interacting protein n=1 Tax=Osmerus mordax TaxID=8014 RepID=UPI0035104370